MKNVSLSITLLKIGQSQECAMIPKKTKADRDKEKLMRKASKPAPVKKLKMTDQKEKTRRIFNEFIRVRDSIETTGNPDFCQCCTCRRIKPNSDNQIHAGHFIKVTHNSVTFAENNLHGQCMQCNSYKGGMEAEYSGYIIKRYGLPIFEYLLSQKHVQRKYTALELIEIQIKYYDKLLKLLINLNGPFEIYY